MSHSDGTVHVPSSAIERVARAGEHPASEGSSPGEGLRLARGVSISHSIGRLGDEQR
jgi:hypothetical protein